MADSGFGQQDPSDGVGDFNPLVFIMQQQLAKISTVKIVIVRAVDTAAKTVDVQPMVNQLDGDNRSTPHGSILGIPYVTWQYGKNAVVADPAVDDIGVMACSDRDISAVKATKVVSNPGTGRKMDAADGIYFGGLLNGAPEQWVKFTDSGLELHDKNSNSLVSSEHGWEFTGPVKFNQLVTAQATIVAKDGLNLDGDILSAGGGEYASNFHTSGTMTADIDVISGDISLQHHRTSGVVVGGGISGAPVP